VQAISKQQGRHRAEAVQNRWLEIASGSS